MKQGRGVAARHLERLGGMIEEQIELLDPDQLELELRDAERVVDVDDIAHELRHLAVRVGER